MTNETIRIYDCGCVTSRPREASCNSYGTRWRAYLLLGKNQTVVKILLKCRDCGRRRHFKLTGTNPEITEYGDKDD